MRPARLLIAATIAIPFLAGCGVERFATTEPAAPAAPAPPPVDMAGRWTLSGVSGACAMNFVGQGLEGGIRPEGGCPGNFYTSRKWAFESNALVIRDHNSTPLAQLRNAGPGRFEGQSSANQPVTLVR